jgi:hypothetical protein
MIGAKGVDHLLKGFVQHIQSSVQPVRTLALIAIYGDYLPSIKQYRLTFLHHCFDAVE